MVILFKKKAAQPEPVSPPPPVHPPGLALPGKPSATSLQATSEFEGATIPSEYSNIRCRETSDENLVEVIVDESEDSELAESLHLVVSLEKTLSRQEEPEANNPVSLTPIAPRDGTVTAPSEVKPVETQPDPPVHQATVTSGESTSFDNPEEDKTSNSKSEPELDGIGRDAAPVESLESEPQLSDLIQECLLYERLLDVQPPTNSPSHEQSETTTTGGPQDPEENAKNQEEELQGEVQGPRLANTGKDVDSEVRSQAEQVGEGIELSQSGQPSEMAVSFVPSPETASIKEVFLTEPIPDSPETSHACNLPAPSLHRNQTTESVGVRGSHSEGKIIEEAPASPGPSRSQNSFLRVTAHQHEPRERKRSLRNMFLLRKSKPM